MPTGQFAYVHTLERLAVALALGLLIGLERGWERRELPEGQRAAGLRTFGIIGLLGGATAQLGTPWILAAIALVLGLVVALGYWRESQADQDVSLTTAISAMLTFCLGAMAGAGELTVAASAAVIVALLLGFKPELHRMLRRIERSELLATLRLLLISVVLLPVLPNRGLGPWSALNPYQLWWMVVLVASLSYVGYFAHRLLGERRGVLLTGLFGGLVSSTALTLSLSRRAREEEGGVDLPAAGIAIGIAVMLPRMMLIVGVIDRLVALRLAAPMLAGAAASLAGAMWFGRHANGAAPPRSDGHDDLRNPLELATALEFGLVLALIMLASHAAAEFVGDRGLYAIAALSGLVDVDAISLSVAAMSLQGAASVETAAGAALSAALVNTLLKPVLAAVIGGSPIAWRVGVVVLAATIAGGAAFFALQ